MTEDEMAGWYHRLDGHEFEQALGDGDRQGSQACYSPWGPKESDKTKRLNNKNSAHTGNFHLSHTARDPAVPCSCPLAQIASRCLWVGVSAGFSWSSCRSC